MAERNGFFLYLDQYAPVSELSLEQKGMLLDAMFAFNSGQPYELTDPVVRMAFGFFKLSFEREQQKYAEICNRRREAARSRWDANASGDRGGRHEEFENANASGRKGSMQTMQMHTSDANASDAMQTMPYPDPEPDPEIKFNSPTGSLSSPCGDDPDAPAGNIEAENSDGAVEEGEDAGESRDAKAPACPYGEIVALYHEILPEHPRVKIVDKARQRNMKARWGDIGARLRMEKKRDGPRERLDYMRRYFEQAARSDFLTGKKAFSNGSVYIANFDKLVSPKGFKLLIEGAYDNDNERGYR